MSAAIDVNLLLYAEDKNSPFHERAHLFLDRLMDSGSPVYITWDVLASFLRISTHPGIFSDPLTPQEAIQDLQALVEHPSVTVLAPSAESWGILAHLCTELHLRGNLIPDAVTVSILQTHHIKTLYTHDRDFWKFPGLKPVDPLK